MKINETTIKTGPCIVLWDGMSKPEEKENGKLSHNLRVAIANNAPERLEVQALADQALANSKWKGVLPAGGHMPLTDTDELKFGPLVANTQAFSASTQRGAPSVYDVAGNKLDPIQYNGKFYAGAKVALLVDCFDYDNKKKGIACGLLGIQIIDDQAPKLDVVGGMAESEVAAAFGAAATTQTAAAGNAMQSDAPPPPRGDSPPPPASDALEPKLYVLSGKNYTAEALIGAGYSQAQIDALPTA
jgi:hypothetical protein